VKASDLAGSDEAGLCSPGSHLIEEHGVDEGVGHGFDGQDRSALLTRWWRTEAGSDILPWFAEQLAARGWSQVDSSILHGLYLRGHEQLYVVIRSTDPAGTVYEVTLTAASR